jgi:hypothetical protein
MNLPENDEDTKEGHFVILMHQIDSAAYIATRLIEMHIVNNVKLS